MFEIRPARFIDAVRLAPRLRVEDAQEIRLVWSVGALEGLLFSLLNSDRACALYGRGQPVALWGVAGTAVSGLDVGVPWMLASRGMFDQRRDLVAQSRRWIDRLLLDCDVLINVTDQTNTAHLRWLAWCGFRPLRVHQRFGPYQRPFQEFYRVNERRHGAGQSLPALLLGRPQPRPLQLPAALQRLVAELAQALAATPVSLPGCLGSVEAAELMEWPLRWRRNVLALLAEVARRATRGPIAAPPAQSDRWHCAAALADTVEVARFAGGDPPDLLAAMSRRVAPRVQPGSGAGAVADSPPPIVTALAGFLDALSLGQRVAPVQGLRLWESALGVSGAQPPWGVRRQALHQALREHHLAARWRGRASPPGGSRGPALERLHGAWRRWPALDAVLRQVLAERPPHWSDADAAGGTLAVASAAADLVARRIVTLPQVGAVSAGYAERHGLYRLLRISLLRAMGLPRHALTPLLIDELSGLLVVAAFEDALLMMPPAGVSDGGRALAAAIDDMWAVADGSSGRAVPLLLPALVCPALATAQLPGALLAWHVLERSPADDVPQRVSRVLAAEQPERRRRLASCLRAAARGLDMVSVQRYLDDHARRFETVAGVSATADGSC